jgi:hypothetical protein
MACPPLAEDPKRRRQRPGPLDSQWNEFDDRTLNAGRQRTYHAIYKGETSESVSYEVPASSR